MALMNLEAMMGHAAANGYCLPAFEVTCPEMARGVLEGAAQCDAPVVLSVDDRLEEARVLTDTLEKLAREASVPVAIDRFGIDGAATAGVAINEGALGVTIEEPGVDAAGAIETARACGVAAVLFEENEELGYLVPPGGGEKVARVVIVRHYSPAMERWPASVARVDHRYLPALIDAELASAGCDSVARFQESVRLTAATETAAAIERCGAAGKAASVMAECRPWLPIEHLIIYNVEGADDAQVERMMEEGRRVLGAIPGVRRIFTGEAVKEGAKYRFCWLVKFVHEAVIDSYRDHPDHVAFADNLFRPVAGDRISIDYVDTDRP